MGYPQPTIMPTSPTIFFLSVGLTRRLSLSERPKSVITKQAVAAVGQGRLMRLYDDLFSIMGQPIAQVRHEC